jgi:hypothetical protein
VSGNIQRQLSNQWVWSLGIHVIAKGRFSQTMETAARIELYVAERAVARHEADFQRWVETVTAPLRYVCIGDGPDTQFCTTPLGRYIEDFEDEDKKDPENSNKTIKSPRRQGMSAFSGFSVARDQRGVWFRRGTGAPDEDRVTIYSFLVDRDLGEVAYYALRERLARTILRERNEDAVLLSSSLDPEQGLQMEFVSEKQCDYRKFAEAFERAAEQISKRCPVRIDLAWKQLHLFQLLQRDLMACAFDHKKSQEERIEIYQPLFRSFRYIVEKVFEGRILNRLSTTVFGSWLRIAGELDGFGDSQAAPTVKQYIEETLNASILEIADSIWRLQGHSLAGAADLGNYSCGVEAFGLVAALNTCQQKLRLGLEELAEKHERRLQNLWQNQSYIPLLLLRDWRGLSYSLNELGEKELAAAFGLRTVDAIVRSSISDERTWYRTMREMFPLE